MRFWFQSLLMGDSSQKEASISPVESLAALRRRAEGASAESRSGRLASRSGEAWPHLAAARLSQEDVRTLVGTKAGFSASRGSVAPPPPREGDQSMISCMSAASSCKGHSQFILSSGSFARSGFGIG